MSEYFAQEQWVAAQQSVIGSMLLDKGWVPEVLAQTRAEDYTQPYRALYLLSFRILQNRVADGQAYAQQWLFYVSVFR